MKLEQRVWSKERGWWGATKLDRSAHLVIVFGASSALAAPDALAELRVRYPEAIVLGCSTAGEVFGARVLDDCIVATALCFEHTALRSASVDLARPEDSRGAGQQLAAALDGEDLQHIFVLSDGLHVNGTELVEGLQAVARPGVAVTGGVLEPLAVELAALPRRLRQRADHDMHERLAERSAGAGRAGVDRGNIRVVEGWSGGAGDESWSRHSRRILRRLFATMHAAQLEHEASSLLRPQRFSRPPLSPE